MLAFDEVPLSYACPEGADGDSLKPMAPVAYNSENFSTYIGVTKYEDPTVIRDKGPIGGGGAIDLHNDQSMHSDVEDADDGFDSENEEVDERRHL